MIIQLLIAICSSSVTPLKDYPKYESSVGPDGQIFGQAASEITAKQPINVPMLATKDYPLEITNRVEANFRHYEAQNVVGAKIIMETAYPTYNLNNNAHVFLLIDSIYKLHRQRGKVNLCGL